jgi:hypothetical protein
LAVDKFISVQVDLGYHELSQAIHQGSTKGQNTPG